MSLSWPIKVQLVGLQPPVSQDVRTNSIFRRATRTHLSVSFVVEKDVFQFEITMADLVL